MCLESTHEDSSKNKQEPRYKNKNQEQEQEQHNTQDLPCFRALCQGKTPTTALAYSLIMGGITGTKVLLELYARTMVLAAWRRRTQGGE